MADNYDLDSCSRCGHSAEAHGVGDRDKKVGPWPCEECDCQNMQTALPD